MKSPNRRTGTAPRTGTRRRLLAAGALLCIGVLPLSACSLFNPPLERDESVHAIFDAEQDIVKMPLDDYPPTTRALTTNTRPFRLPLSSATPNTGRATPTPTKLPNLKARRVAIRAESTVPGTSNTPRSTVFRSETPTPNLPSPSPQGQASAPRRGSSSNVMTRPARPWTPRFPKVRGPRTTCSPHTVVSPPRQVAPFTVARYTASSKRSGSSASQTGGSPPIRQGR